VIITKNTNYIALQKPKIGQFFFKKGINEHFGIPLPPPKYRSPTS